VWKVANQLLDTEYWRAAERHRSDKRRRRNVEVTMTSELAKEPEEDE
jgi:hypothetical protein